jgi:pyridoxamine 5'-phosphate oxidase family protein
MTLNQAEQRFLTRQIRANPRVAFVVDEVTEASMAGAHFLEIRGFAEAVTDPAPTDDHLAPEIIRIHPTRVIAFNVDPDNPGLLTRDITADGAPPHAA